MVDAVHARSSKDISRIRKVFRQRFADQNDAVAAAVVAPNYGASQKITRMRSRTLTRSQIVETIGSKLAMPRVQLSILLAITASFAFLFSAVMLRVGVTSMAVRYPVAVVVGYGVFLLLLRIWVWLQSDEPIGSIDVPADVLIPNIDLPGGAVADRFSFGGGGDFAGAGAGGSFSDVDAPSPAPVMFAAGSSGTPGSGGGPSLGSIDVDLDDGWALVIVALVLLVVLGALVYVVYIAPVLMAELIIDAAIVTSLYKPTKNIERRYWLLTALRKTAIPAVIVAALFGTAGFVMQSAEPTAKTVGEFVRAAL